MKKLFIYSLKRTLGKLALSFRALETIMIEIESAINKRPITYVSSGINDLNALDFLITSTSTDGENQEETLATDQLRRLLEKHKEIASNLWKRWKKEYLRTLHVWRTNDSPGVFPMLAM